METRRIRRLERRRTHRTVVLAASATVLGVAVGMSLPQSTTVALVLLACAACSSVVVAARADSRAPLHGLRRAVRLPMRTTISATLESFRSRLVGTLRSVVPRRPAPTPAALDEADDEPDDEPDDEAVAWWGTTSSPTPVVAAPIRSARVPADESGDPPSRVARVLDGVRSRVGPLRKRWRRSADEVGASS